MIDRSKLQPDWSKAIQAGNAILACFLLLMLTVLAVALGNHRREIDQMRRQIEALEKRK